MIKIVIADDHRIVRDGLKSLLSDEKDILIIGEAANGEEALNKTHELKPDILMADISMPGMNGIEMTRILCKEDSKTKVLIVSMHDNEDYINQALEAGASGYLLKDSSKEELLKAIKAVQNGETYCSGDVSKILLNKFLVSSRSKKLKTESEDRLELTKREKEILKLISDGLSNKEIANLLFVSTRTIDTHRYNVMQKLNVKNGAELVRIAFKLNLIN
ncbi:MAG: DNA-binding response regulator [Bacteroidetes bacterium RIFCSPLOWO2_12_FULL_35_15]|nr:MAG: DNA-binding response regulator [Bacteroidetes bacterium RIFCSPLOWO2_12_FULL_35_15]